MREQTMNRLLLAACLLGLAGPASALEDSSQVPYGNSEGVRATYSAASPAYAGYTTPTDISCITGSATRTLRVTRVGFSGRATAGTAIDVLLIKHVVANTLGTPSTLVVVPHDTNNLAATGTAVSYGAAPTINSSTRVVRAQITILPASASSSAAATVEWDNGNVNDQTFVLRGIAEQLCLNLNGVANPGGAAYNLFWEWIEETTSVLP